MDAQGEKNAYKEMRTQEYRMKKGLMPEHVLSTSYLAKRTPDDDARDSRFLTVSCPSVQQLCDAQHLNLVPRQVPRCCSVVGKQCKALQTSNDT